MGFLVTCVVIIERTMAPWQGVLERVKEVPEHPGQDGVVENAHQERHKHGGNPYTQEINDKQHVTN